MADYILRKVDVELWRRFRERAVSEGHTLRWVLLALIDFYIRRGLPKP